MVVFWESIQPHITVLLDILFLSKYWPDVKHNAIDLNNDSLIVRSTMWIYVYEAKKIMSESSDRFIKGATVTCKICLKISFGII